MFNKLFPLVFVLLSTSAIASQSIYEGKVIGAPLDIKHAPDAIVLKDANDNDSELVVFYRYNDNQKSGFSLTDTINDDGSLLWGDDDNGTFTNEDVFKTSSIAPAPIQYDGKLYLFGITKEARNIIYNSFSSVDNLLAGTWDHSKFVDTGKNANKEEGQDTISLLNYDNDIMMSYYKDDFSNYFSFARCDSSPLNCANDRVDGEYWDPTSMITVIDSFGKSRTLLFVRNQRTSDHNIYNIRIYEYKRWDEGSEPTWKVLYAIENSTDKFSGAIFNGVQVDDKLYLYYKSQSGNIAQMFVDVDNIDDQAWSIPSPIKDTTGELISDVQGGPKAVVYGDYVYVFYVDQKEKVVKYFVLNVSN